MRRACIACGQAFEATATWQRRCWACWRKGKDEQLRREAFGHGYSAGLHDAERGWHEGYAEGLRDGRRERGPVLDAELLQALISLCHPDRHAGRVDLATRVTQQLLAIRDGLRRVA
jgi:hypothetical protein